MTVKIFSVCVAFLENMNFNFISCHFLVQMYIVLEKENSSFGHKKFKKTPSKVAQKNLNPLLSDPSEKPKMAYRLTVYRTGTESALLHQVWYMILQGRVKLKKVRLIGVNWCH